MENFIIRDLEVLAVQPGKAYTKSNGQSGYIFATCSLTNSCIPSIEATFDDRLYQYPAIGSKVTVNVGAYHYTDKNGNTKGKIKAELLNQVKLSDI